MQGLPFKRAGGKNLRDGEVSLRISMANNPTKNVVVKQGSTVRFVIPEYCKAARIKYEACFALGIRRIGGLELISPSAYVTEEMGRFELCVCKTEDKAFQSNVRLKIHVESELGSGEPHDRLRSARMELNLKYGTQARFVVTTYCNKAKIPYQSDFGIFQYDSTRVDNEEMLGDEDPRIQWILPSHPMGITKISKNAVFCVRSTYHEGNRYQSGVQEESRGRVRVSCMREDGTELGTVFVYKSSSIEKLKREFAKHFKISPNMDIINAEGHGEVMTNGIAGELFDADDDHDYHVILKERSD